MGVSTNVVDAFAEEMLGVFRRHTLERRTERPIASLTVDEAYDVQDRVIGWRVASGERVAGYKVGCTSAPIRAQFGLADPVRGCLMEPHVLFGDATIDLATVVDCAVEPEFVLKIGRRLEGHDIDDPTLLAAIDAMAPGIEVHNYRFFHGVPTAQELVASNAIHAAVVVGPWASQAAELDHEEVSLHVNGVLAESGVGAAIMGGPLRSLRWLAGHLTDRGRAIEPGELVIPGSPVGLVRVEAGDVVEARFPHLGSAQARFA